VGLAQTGLLVTKSGSPSGHWTALSNFSVFQPKRAQTKIFEKIKKKLTIIILFQQIQLI
jgi:hypothetical protein